MNKVKIIFLSITTILIFSCKGNLQKNIEINQNEANLPVVIRLAKDNKDRVISLELPGTLKIENSTNERVKFLRIYYKYNENIPQERKSGFGISLYDIKNELLENIRNKKTIMKDGEILNYIFYSSHYIDSTISKELISYSQKTYPTDKDTLHIGTVDEFKQKHKELFEKLTKNDSISIQFLDGKKLGERVTVPVEW